MEKLNNIDSVITLIIPFITISVFNCGIIYSVRHFTVNYQQWQFKQEHKLGERSSSNNSNSSNSPDGKSRIKHPNYHNYDFSRTFVSQISAQSIPSLHRGQTKRHHQLHVTKMLLAVSSIFLLLNLPCHAIRMYDFFKGISDRTYTTTLTVIRLQKIFTYVYYVNFAINFLLYSLCGANFRRALKGLFKRFGLNSSGGCSRRQRRNSTLSTKYAARSVVTTKI